MADMIQTGPPPRIGIDLGGTKIEAILLDSQGVELARERIPTPARDYGAIVEQTARLVLRMEASQRQRACVGVATPGSEEPASGLIKNSNTVVLNGRPLRRDLEAMLARPIRLANDANCFAVSEATDGAGAGAKTVLGVILGTGVGAGIVIAGNPLRGANGIAGEWGHNPLPWPLADELPGARCYCGRHGCLETFLSGAGLLAEYRRGGVFAADAKDVVQRAEMGDAAARRALDRYAGRLARGLASLINILDPEVIVLGGGLGQVEHWYREVPRIWGRYVFSTTVATRLVPPRHGAASGVRGAAWLWRPGESQVSVSL